MQTDERRDWHVQRTLRFCFMNPERFVWVVSLLCVLMIRYCILAWSLYLCSSAAARRHLLMLASTLNRTFITNARIATSIIFTWDKIYSLFNPINWLQHGCLCIVRQVYHLLLTFFRENNTLISNEIKSLVILILIFLKKLIFLWLLLHKYLIMYKNIIFFQQRNLNPGLKWSMYCAKSLSEII